MSDPSATKSASASAATLRGYRLTLNGRRYALGLFWQVTNLTSARAIRAEAIRFASKLPENHPFVCVKQDGVPQYAVGHEKGDYASNLLSAAETLFQNIPADSSFLGAWRVEDKFWSCIIKAGAIYPNGDGVWESEQEAHAIIQQNALTDDWNQIIAPDHWSIPNAKDVPLDNFFKKPGHSRLTPTKGGNKIYILAAAAICAIALYGAQRYIGQEIPIVIPETFNQPVAPKEVVQPAWKYLPKSAAVHKACMKNIRDFYKAFLKIPGWIGIHVVCDLRERKITADWSRSTGTASIFRKYAERLFPGEKINFGPAGQTASLSRSWTPEKNDIGETPPELSSEDIEIKLWSLRQRTQINLSINRSELDNRIIAPPPGTIAKKGRGIMFTVSTQVAPEKVFYPLYRMGGSVVYVIRFDHQNKSWTMEGFIHAKDAG